MKNPPILPKFDTYKVDLDFLANPDEAGDWSFPDLSTLSLKVCHVDIFRQFVIPRLNTLISRRADDRRVTSIHSVVLDILFDMPSAKEVVRDCIQHTPLKYLLPKLIIRY